MWLVSATLFLHRFPNNLPKQKDDSRLYGLGLFGEGNDGGRSDGMFLFIHAPLLFPSFW